MASPHLLVEYQYRNKAYQVQGIRTDRGYLFADETTDKSVVVSTLNWQPYIGENLCKQGWVQQLTVALLHSQGYAVHAQFRPWARAVQEVESGESHILYPEYYIEDRAPSDIFPGTRRRQHLALSDPLPGGSIALLKRKGEPDQYQGDLTNLKGARIAVVRGYQNTPRFDALMDQGYFKITEATHDLQMAKMLLAGRVNLIIGDPKVIFYNISQANVSFPGITPDVSKLEVVEPALQYNHLYYAISRKKDNWQQLLGDINTALAEFAEAGELESIVSHTTRYCGFGKNQE
ncbi:transporter substrate-binding domain-containing protein [Lacimicrobium sp. SS2-24]|uniref:substrate-binding periplasmic protein n=1 Tax=Lacimicrobium sp. SS2-24 TaxID=2005569 RepID=UPI000B4BA817|nr:transporter substrate-binding domain-containing protein [Lacimicrobium sp. SS2-24]